MSVNLNLARVVAYSQIATFGDSEGCYYETLTSGWPNGSRNRVKRFSTISGMYAYFNKLHTGGWISDDSYDEAWKALCDLEIRVRRGTAMLLPKDPWSDTLSITLQASLVSDGRVVHSLSAKRFAQSDSGDY